MSDLDQCHSLSGLVHRAYASLAYTSVLSVGMGGEGADGFAEGVVALEFTDTYEAVVGDAVSVYVVAEDSFGYIHKTLAHFWKKSGGATAETVYGGESIYDKQGNMIYGF